MHGHDGPKTHTKVACAAAQGDWPTAGLVSRAYSNGPDLNHPLPPTHTHTLVGASVAVTGPGGRGARQEEREDPLPGLSYSGSFSNSNSFSLHAKHYILPAGLSRGLSAMW